MTGHLPARATALSAALLFTTLIVTPLSGQGAGPEWRALQKRVEELYTAGKYDSARIAAEQTLRHAEAHAAPGHPDIAESMSDLALMDTYTNRMDEADSLYRRAIAMLEVAGDSTAGLLAIVLNNYANVQRSSRELVNAERLYMRALEIQERTFGKEDVAISTTLNNLAALYSDTERFGEAEEMYGRVIKIMQGALDTGSTSYAVTLNNLAECYGMQGRYRESIGVHRKALDLRLQLLDAEHPHVLISKNNLAIGLLNYGDARAAALLMEEVLEIRTRLYGMDHPMTISSAGNLAEAYKALDRYPESEHLCERVLEALERIHGPDAPETAVAVNNLAWVEATMGRYVRAEELYRRALAIDERAYSGEHSKIARTLNNLGVLLEILGRYEEARELHERALAVRRRIFGPGHATVANSLGNLASLYISIGQFERAEALCRQALEIGERALAPEHPETIRYRNNLGMLCNEMGRYAEAESYLRRTIALLKDSEARNSILYSTALGNLAGVLYDLGLYTEAEDLYLEAARGDSVLLGTKSTEYATDLGNLASLYSEMGMEERAYELLLKVLHIREELFGREHPAVARTMSRIAEMYAEWGRFAEAEQLLETAVSIEEQAAGQENLSLAPTLGRLAHLYKSMGNLARAEKLLHRVIRIKEASLGTGHPDLAVSLNGLAVLEQQCGNYSVAWELLRRSMAINRNAFGWVHRTVATDLNNMGFLAMEMGRVDTAEILLKHALLIYDSMTVAAPVDQAMPMHNLAALYRRLGRYEDAEMMSLKSLDFLRAIYGSNHPRIVKSLNARAELHDALGNREIVTTIIQEAAQVELELLLRNLPGFGERERENLVRQFQEGWEKRHSFEFRILSIDSVLSDVYDRQLAFKGLLHASLRARRHHVIAHNDGKAAALHREWVYASELFDAAMRMTVRQRELAGWNLDSLEQRCLALDKQLSRHSSKFAQHEDHAPVRWQDVRTALAPGEAAVEILRFRLYTTRWTDTVYYAALIIDHGSTDHPRLVLMENGNAMEEEGARAYRRGILGEWPALKRAYRMFWSAIDSALGDASTVYLSADGIYNQLNVETLMREDGDYLAAHRSVVLLPSTRNLVRRDPAAVSGGENTAVLVGAPDFALDPERHREIALVFRTEPAFGMRGPVDEALTRAGWNPLPGAASEIAAVHAVLTQRGWQTALFTGDSALEEVVKRVRRPRLLHLATHGYFLKDRELAHGERSGMRLHGMDAQRYAEHPLLRSGLVFAGAHAPGQSPAAGSAADSVRTPAPPAPAEDVIRRTTRRVDDGYLSAMEAQLLDLEGTDLVVLSACETGLGVLKAGEGVYGLQRSLQLAGARNILMSLWKVDDAATERLMTWFYDAWLAGSSPREALRAAQAELRRNPDYAAPVHWGAFVLISQ